VADRKFSRIEKGRQPQREFKPTLTEFTRTPRYRCASLSKIV
jgi:hypothetical protein